MGVTADANRRVVWTDDLGDQQTRIGDSVWIHPKVTVSQQRRLVSTNAQLRGPTAGSSASLPNDDTTRRRSSCRERPAVHDNRPISPFGSQDHVAGGMKKSTRDRQLAMSPSWNCHINVTSTMADDQPQTGNMPGKTSWKKMATPRIWMAT